jgi:hypothetical protein
MINKINLKENKRGVSEMISYVLLIVIAMSLAVGVYAWLKFYIPSTQNQEVCGQDYALTINDYSCKDKLLTIKIENRGMFNITGFIIKANNNSKYLPITVLESKDSAILKQKDHYFFTSPIKPSDSKEIKFDYTPLDKVERIQIQPFLLSSKMNKTILCERIIDRTISDCK